MTRKILKSRTYLPVTCHVLVKLKYPNNWQRLLQPFIAEIKRFTAIYGSLEKGVIRLCKISDAYEIELIHAAVFQLQNKNSMNLLEQLQGVEKDLAEYNKQLHHLCTSDTISAADKNILSKHYRKNINALLKQKDELLAAIEVVGEENIPVNNSATAQKNNC